jgi:hypothetical protein
LGNQPDHQALQTGPEEQLNPFAGIAASTHRYGERLPLAKV